MQTAELMLTVNPMTFAKRLKDSRLAAGMTQRQLADKCGISDRTVSARETGLAEGILAEHLFAVADAMKVDPRWLATGRGAMTPSIAEALGQLPAHQVEAVQGLIRSLKN